MKVSGNGVQGARLIYPNDAHAPAGARYDFWNYDPDQKGWYIYGQGSVILAAGVAARRASVSDPTKHQIRLQIEHASLRVH